MISARIKTQIREINESIKLSRLYISALITDKHIRSLRPRLKKLKGRYTGKRCFIMGNGPSINQTNLSLLKDDYVWGFNRCNLLFDRIDWRPAFYMSVDTRVTPDISEEINRLITDLRETIFFFPKKYRILRILPTAENVYYYHEKRINDKSLPYGNFSINPPAYVRSVRTVTIAAIQIAVYLGFNPIYLIGCDTDYKQKGKFRYEDEKKYEIISMSDSDTDHFTKDYFGKGKKFHKPHPEKMLFSYFQVKQVCDEHNIEIYNATIGGKLEVFPRVDYHALFK